MTTFTSPVSSMVARGKIHTGGRQLGRITGDDGAGPKRVLDVPSTRAHRQVVDLLSKLADFPRKPTV